MEKLVMRSLTDVQGQLFILLKYLIKKVISEKVKGLKTYHAKCLLFYMLDETAAAEWQPCNLVSLTKQALQKLLHNLQSSESGSSECMRHFFMRDAIVYLKSGHNEKEEIAQEVTHTIENLTHHLTHFKDMQLKPLHSQAGRFCFHPFLIIPDIWNWETPNSQTLEYHEIYDCVRHVMLQLSQSDSTLQSLTASINRIPDFAKTARETLRVMAFLKFNKREDAVRVLCHIRGHSVSRGIVTDMTGDESAEDMVWQHLKCSDSAWKFCFQISERPTFEFLPEFVRDIFPTEMNNYSTFFFMNFDAVKKCLMLELIGDDMSEADTWFAEMMQSEDADVQELMMALHYCRD
ncbi:MAG: hypothetical protein V2I33_19315, partial [Kangiellaceae bacterium]|nr:hypothetical protein [Kangiellaceae bacterium]